MAEKLDLEHVTLVSIDTTRRFQNALAAMKFSMQNIEFAEAKFLSNRDVKEPNIESIKIDDIKGKNAYSFFCIKKLVDYIDTRYVLIVQWDGYVLNHEAWTDEFMKYDYVGARWVWDKVVGNGGFSLRSKDLLNFLKRKEFPIYHPEDAVICRTQRKLIEANGFKFAPENIAYKFAVENEPYKGQFGWHGGGRPAK